MRIVALSDTHEMHQKIEVPPGDILIHAGDWTHRGAYSAIHHFLEWFGSQSHQYKILIPGNHELTLDANSTSLGLGLELVKNKTNELGIHFLLNSKIIINGWEIYGSPITPEFGNWAFSTQRGSAMAQEWSRIPPTTNILITHGPPYSILDLVRDIPANRGRDLHQGCQDLARRISQLQDLKLHIFGHLHFNGGQKIEQKGVTYVNAAICTEDYHPTNSPIVIDI